MEQADTSTAHPSMRVRSKGALAAHNLGLFQVALTTALGSVPYNSAAQFLEFYSDHKLASNWGMSCVRQSVWADEYLQSIDGIRGTYVRGGRHVAAIYVDTQGMVILDPYLLHQLPLVLRASEAHEGCTAVAVPAYPRRIDESGNPRWGKLRAIWDMGKRTLQLDYTRFSPRRQQNYLYRSFALSLDEIATFPSPLAVARARLVHPEQNNLSVRVLNLARQKLSEVILPLADVSDARPASQSQLISRNNQGQVSVFGSDSFTADLSDVAEMVGVTPMHIIDLLLHTSIVYASVAPGDRVLASYPLVNE